MTNETLNNIVLKLSEVDQYIFTTQRLNEEIRVNLSNRLDEALIKVACLESQLESVRELLRLSQETVKRFQTTIYELDKQDLFTNIPKTDEIDELMRDLK